jgi:ABC-type glucose/galactose transport system permease subunit
MPGTLINVVILLIILGVVLYLLNLLPVDPQLLQIIRVIVILFAILWLLNLFFHVVPGV